MRVHPAVPAFVHFVAVVPVMVAMRAAVLAAACRLFLDGKILADSMFILVMAYSFTGAM